MARSLRVVRAVALEPELVMTVRALDVVAPGAFLDWNRASGAGLRTLADQLLGWFVPLPSH